MSVAKLRFVQCVALIAIGLVFYSLFGRRHVAISASYPVKAAQFIPAPKCSVIKYQVLDWIRKDCVEEKYHISNYRDYGLDAEYRNYKWQRISNDAVFMACPGFSDSCQVFRIIPHFYYQ